MIHAQSVLIVCGPPCAGKSTVARRLRNSLGWPLLAKDAFKESLFESLGWSDRAWSKRLSVASYGLLFDVARELLVAGHSCIIEGNFRWHENEAHFMRLIEAGKARFAQVYCTALPEVLVARWRERIESRARHPGHVDGDAAAEIEAELRAHAPRPLPIGNPPVLFDSTQCDFAALDTLAAALGHRTHL